MSASAAPVDDRIHATVSTKYRQVTVCLAEELQTHWYTSRCKKLTLPGCVLYAYDPLGDPTGFPSDLPDRLRELQRLREAMDTTPGGWNPKGPLRRAYRDYQLALVMELMGTPLRRSARLAAKAR